MIHARVVNGGHLDHLLALSLPELEEIAVCLVIELMGIVVEIVHVVLVDVGRQIHLESKVEHDICLLFSQHEVYDITSNE